MLIYGLHAQYQGADAAKPHILSYATARSVANDGVLEVWSGPTSAARVLRVNKDGQVQLQAGSASAPALAPEDDRDTGIYFATATPEVGIAVGGARRVGVTATEVTFSRRILVPAGSLAEPSISGSADVGTGVRIETAAITLVVGGAAIATFDASATSLAVPGVISASGGISVHNVGDADPCMKLPQSAASASSDPALDAPEGFIRVEVVTSGGGGGSFFRYIPYYS